MTSEGNAAVPALDALTITVVVDVGPYGEEQMLQNFGGPTRGVGLPDAFA